MKRNAKCGGPWTIPLRLLLLWTLRLVLLRNLIDRLDIDPAITNCNKSSCFHASNNHARQTDRAGGLLLLLLPLKRTGFSGPCTTHGEGRSPV